jgi:hypothetical protein
MHQTYKLGETETFKPTMKKAQLRNNNVSYNRLITLSHIEDESYNEKKDKLRMDESKLGEKVEKFVNNGNQGVFRDFMDIYYEFLLSEIILRKLQKNQFEIKIVKIDFKRQRVYNQIKWAINHSFQNNGVHSIEHNAFDDFLDIISAGKIDGVIKRFNHTEGKDFFNECINIIKMYG